MHEHPQISRQRFLSVTVLNAVITLAEIIGGLMAGSLALLSDAVHNLTDTLSIVLGYVASRISTRPENQYQTYGYRRAEILAALLNAIILVIVVIGLLYEAIVRFAHPEPINGPLMLTVAIIGLIANIVSLFLLHAGVNHSLNLKATYLHILGDTLSSVAVIIGALVVTLTQVTWVDPALTILVALLIAKETLPVIKQASLILMQTGPKVDYDQITKDLTALPGVNHIHHLHAWMLDEHTTAISLHINCTNQELSQIEPLYQQIETILKTKYHFNHVTIQAECHRGEAESLIANEIDHFEH
ncbi:cation diffusion facilitator family transporter [Limosilactobacillus equigenerosi]|uniref:Cation efflux system protein n=1 Tax=Limosilactobacillus equigenerosi DSM 18793 = JCM 14505 TaxID=1423742 RepID=A0A0R1UXX7_9LACO|nr:cation diffusion facilitator family transporter [Limosilactobacillus equigenerosi]KRL96056.1 Cation efflux system protein [Limosilactobacillus equigenerosi DSM 18793 = JCM 14505]